MAENRKALAAYVVALTLSMLVGLSSARANPGCNLDDIGQAAKDTYNAVPSSCAAQAGDPVFYPLTGFLIAFTQTPEGNDFCDAAEKLQSSASDAQKQLASYWGKLSQEQQGKLKDFLPAFADISAGASDVSGALDIVSCACKVARWKGPGELYGDFSACVADALCSAQDWFHDNVSSAFNTCTSVPPQPPQLVDCRPNPATKSSGIGWDWNSSVPFVGASGQCYQQGTVGYTCQGSFCFSVDIARNGTGNYCYCPPAMQKPDWYSTGSPPGDCILYITCACPDGTSPLSNDGPGAYICMCPSGLPVADDGSCPKPPPPCNCTCPNNQILISKDSKSCTCTCGCKEGEFKLGGKCVSACANAGDVMLASGACCSGSQANACGGCCPPGMKPDPQGGGCVSALMPQTPQSPVGPHSVPNALKKL